MDRISVAVKPTVDHKNGMSRDDPPLRIRLPEALKATVQARAADSRRSMNAEIIRRLEWSLSAEADFAEFESKAEERAEGAARRLLIMRATDDPDPLEARLRLVEADLAAIKAQLNF